MTFRTALHNLLAQSAAKVLYSSAYSAGPHAAKPYSISLWMSQSLPVLRNGQTGAFAKCLPITSTNACRVAGLTGSATAPIQLLLVPVPAVQALSGPRAAWQLNDPTGQLLDVHG